MHGLRSLVTTPRSFVTAGQRDVSQFAAARSELRLRFGLCASAGGSVFLCTYMLLHALHVAQLDFWLVRPLSPIPLFATFEASSVSAALVGCFVASSVSKPEPALTKLPKLIATLTVLFVLEVVAFP